VYFLEKYAWEGARGIVCASSQKAGKAIPDVFLPDLQWWNCLSRCALHVLGVSLSHWGTTSTQDLGRKPLHFSVKYSLSALADD